MQIQPPPRHLDVRTTKVTRRTFSIHYFPRKKKKNRLTDFLKKFNPSNWFNDFRNIEITLEEFGTEAKKQEVLSCEPMSISQKTESLTN